MTVRTRIAPSPTGAPHIGTAYIALFNHAFARRHGGQFILRIEDTDQTRSTRQSEEDILAALRWIGLPWDEGPDVGGPCGPYRQSERLALYRPHALELVASGHAYPCFCTAERLRALREQQTAAKQEFVGYDRHCAALPAEEAARRMAAGEPYVIRLRVPTGGDCVFQDLLRGEIRIPLHMIDDQILLKADGFPTYHLANVVDDHLMRITHVIRGEEWISSTPKHVLLYQAFGWEPPQFAHLPLLRNPDKSKLSKRKNPTSILYYRRAGYLPEALVNFLGLMAYSPADGNEMFTLERMGETFDLARVSLGGPIFDIQKLRSFNARYIRALAPDALLARLKGWVLNDETWLRILPLARERMGQLSDLVPLAAFLFADRLTYAPQDLLQGLAEGDRVLRLLKFGQWEMEKLNTWNAETVRGVFDTLAARESLPLKQVLPAFYVALTGAAVALPVFDSMVLMGKDLCLRRIADALEALETLGHALSGKQTKVLTKEYEEKYGAAP